MTFPPLSLGDRLTPPDVEVHPDRRAAFADLGGWRLLAASAVVAGHLHENRPRDDAFAARTLAACLAAAVADGVGSHSHSRFGAAFAVDYLCRHLLRLATAGQATASTPGTPRRRRGNRRRIFPPRLPREPIPTFGLEQ